MVHNAIRERDADVYARLEEAGFLLDYGDNGSVQLAHSAVRELTEDTVVLEDGTELPADLGVYATGNGSMNGWLRDLIPPEVADPVGKAWGLGSDTTKDPGPWEGKQRNMWQPTQQRGLWFHGGNLHQSRYFSLYLALQPKARQEGPATPGYALAPPITCPDEGKERSQAPT